MHFPTIIRGVSHTISMGEGLTAPNQIEVLFAVNRPFLVDLAGRPEHKRSGIAAKGIIGVQIPISAICIKAIPEVIALIDRRLIINPGQDPETLRPARDLCLGRDPVRHIHLSANTEAVVGIPSTVAVRRHLTKAIDLGAGLLIGHLTADIRAPTIGIRAGSFIPVGMGHGNARTPVLVDARLSLKRCLAFIAADITFDIIKANRHSRPAIRPDRSKAANDACILGGDPVQRIKACLAVLVIDPDLTININPDITQVQRTLDPNANGPFVIGADTLLVLEGKAAINRGGHALPRSFRHRHLSLKIGFVRQAQGHITLDQRGINQIFAVTIRTTAQTDVIRHPGLGPRAIGQLVQFREGRAELILRDDKDIIPAKLTIPDELARRSGRADRAAQDDDALDVINRVIFLRAQHLTGFGQPRHPVAGLQGDLLGTNGEVLTLKEVG